MPTNALFKNLLKNVPASASVAADGTSSSEFGTFVDTGSYTLNAALSGSLLGGMPDNKITVFAGDSGVGKTFFILGIIKAWLEQHNTGVCVYFDSESAVTNQMLEDRGIDLNRVIKVEPETIEQFRQSALAILDNYEESKTTDPMVMVLDSLGNLSSLKEVTDIREQKDSRDMTKSQLIRGTFRVLRLRLSKLRVPMIVSNHVYAVIGCLEPETAVYQFAMNHGVMWVVPSAYLFTRPDGTTITASEVVVGETISDKMGTGVVAKIEIEYESTQVVMADGTLRRIDTIVVGDQVQTLDGPKPVTTLYSYDVTERYLITFDDGTSVSATPNHKFLTNTNIWVRADELTKGLSIATHAYTAAEERRIASVVPFTTKEPVRVYDFTVEDVHHYVLSNGVVSHNSYVPTSALSGGAGLIYVSDSIAMLSKSKDRDKTSKEVVGNFIKVKMFKSRLSRADTESEVRISYTGGLDRYHGLLDLAVESKLVTNSNGRYTFPGFDKPATAKQIAASPDTYFTEDFIKKLDDLYVKPNFSYGTTLLPKPDADDEDDA